MGRVVEVRVKLTRGDVSLFRRAAERHWPGAELTDSGAVLGFARIAARCILSKLGKVGRKYQSGKRQPKRVSRVADQ